MNLKLLRCFLSLIVMLTVLQGCTKQKLYTDDFIAMDTFFSITVPEENQSVVEGVKALVNEINRLLNVNNSESDIAKINKNSGEYVKVKNMTFEILTKAKEIAERTNGHFDPTIEPLVKLWDFSNRVVPDETKLKDTLPLVNHNYININEETKSIMLDKCGMEVNVGAIAKGFAAEKLKQYLLNERVRHALISAGGNTYALGTKPDGSPWKIAIRHPRKKDHILGYVELNDMAVDTSGDYERFFVKDGIRYHHILDPKTGYPASGLISVTVITKDPVKADALATALFVMGSDKAKRYVKSLKDIEAIMVTEKMEVFISSGAKEIFRPEKDLEYTVFN